MIFLDVRPPQSAEDRRETAVAHLALARSLNCRNRHLGNIPKKKYLILRYQRIYYIPKNVTAYKREGELPENGAPYFVSMTDELIKTESAS